MKDNVQIYIKETIKLVFHIQKDNQEKKMTIRSHITDHNKCEQTKLSISLYIFIIYSTQKW